MIKLINKSIFLDLNVNLSFKKLISETISTWSKKHPKEIEESLTNEEIEKRKKDILRAVKDGYSSILEMPIIHFQTIMPRYLTLALVSFSVGSNFLQQSLRYTMPLIKEKGEKALFIFVPKSLKNYENKILVHTKKGIEIYMKLIEEIKVLKTRKPEEDARYHLPLCIGTFISANINFSHVINMLSLLNYQEKNNLKFPTLWKDFVYEMVKKLEIKEIIYEIGKEINIGKFYPNAYPFITSNIVKKLEKKFEKNNKNEVKLISYNLDSLKIFSKEEIKEIIKKGTLEGCFNEFYNVIFEFAIKESCVSRHQTIRHRTIPQQSLSLYDSANRNELIIPSSINELKEKIKKDYFEYLQDSIYLYENLKNEDENNSIIVLPSNIALITVLRIDGYNIFNFRGFIGNRCCELAQAETQIIASLINNKINQVLKEEGYGELTKITHANCFKLRKCPELIERAINCSIFQRKSFERNF